MLLVLQFKKVNRVFPLIILLLVYVVYVLCRRKKTIRMSRISYDNQEVLLLSSKLNGAHHLFMIDTGYAGPPVLSTSYLFTKKAYFGGVEKRYYDAMQQMETHVSIDDHTRTVNTFISRSKCVSYTSGCTMKLMSIGDLREQQAFMFMCDALQFKTVHGIYRTMRKSDVLVTHTLPGSVHILTCDYLVQLSPCMLCMKKEELCLQMDIAEFVREKMSFYHFPFKQNGGAFVVDMFISGIKFWLTVDTGAPGPICLSHEAGNRLNTADVMDVSIFQQGVNGERVHSQLLSADVVFANETWTQCQVLHNDKNMHGADGYVGLAFLRAYDLLISTHGIGFRLSGLAPKPLSF